MSASGVIEQSVKRRAELRRELALLKEKRQVMMEEMDSIDERLTAKLEEKMMGEMNSIGEELTAKLEEKVKEKRAVLEDLEAQKKDMERQLEELQVEQKSSSVPVVCQYCGCENVPGANFCERCGKRIGVVGSASGDVKVLEKPVVPA